MPITARHGASAEAMRDAISTRFGYDLAPTVDEIRPGYRHSEAAQRSVPQALVCAFEAIDFEDAIRNAVSIGGDSDTIAAIAGAVAEARFGMPEAIGQLVWNYLTPEMRRCISQLYSVDLSAPPIK